MATSAASVLVVDQDNRGPSLVRGALGNRALVAGVVSLVEGRRRLAMDRFDAVVIAWRSLAGSSVGVVGELGAFEREAPGIPITLLNDASGDVAVRAGLSRWPVLGPAELTEDTLLRVPAFRAASPLGSMASEGFLQSDPSVGILVVDMASRVLFADPFAQNLVGVRAGERVVVPVGTIHQGVGGLVHWDRSAVEWGGREVVLYTLRQVAPPEVDAISLGAVEPRARATENGGTPARSTAHDVQALLSCIEHHCDVIEDGTGGQVELPLASIRSACANARQRTRSLLAASRSHATESTSIGRNLNGWHAMLEPLLGAGGRLDFVLTSAPDEVALESDDLYAIMCQVMAFFAGDGSGAGRVLVSTRVEDLDEWAAAADSAGQAGSYLVLEVCGERSLGRRGELAARFLSGGEAWPAATLEGLATIRGLVGDGGGHLRAAADPAFSLRICLPIDGLAVGTDYECNDIEGLLGNGETVLLLERFSSVRDFVTDALEMAGYEVLHAMDTDQATRLCRNHPGRIDLYISDVILSDVRGPDVARRLQKIRPHMTALFTSAYSSPRVLEAASLDPGASVLSKPFSAEELLVAVRTTFDATEPTPTLRVVRRSKKMRAALES